MVYEKSKISLKDVAESKVAESKVAEMVKWGCYIILLLTCVCTDM